MVHEPAPTYATFISFLLVSTLQSIILFLGGFGKALWASATGVQTGWAELLCEPSLYNDKLCRPVAEYNMVSNIIQAHED